MFILTKNIKYNSKYKTHSTHNSNRDFIVGIYLPAFEREPCGCQWCGVRGQHRPSRSRHGVTRGDVRRHRSGVRREQNYRFGDGHQLVCRQWYRWSRHQGLTHKVCIPFVKTWLRL